MKEEASSIWDLRKTKESVAKKVTSAKQLMGDEISEKLINTEEIIGQVKDLNEYLKQAEDNLKYYTDLKEAGELPEEGEDKLKKAEELIVLVKEEMEKRNRYIEKLESDPGVALAEQEMSETEDVRRTAKKIFEEGLVKLNPQADQVIESMRNLSVRRTEVAGKIEQKEAEISKIWQEIAGAVSEAQKSLSDKLALKEKLGEILRESEGAKALKEKLTEVRESLGWFKGSEKDALDSVIYKESMFFEYGEAEESLVKLRAELEKIIGKDKDVVVEQYKNLMSKTWEHQEEISKSLKLENTNDLPYRINERIKKGMQYDRVLWKVIEEEAGGDSLIYKKTKE